MPRVNIYIRNEDLDNWEAIENKPEWLHNHLNGFDTSISLKGVKMPVTVELPTDTGNQLIEKVRERGVCKNGHILNKFGKCMEKGCKYS